MTTPQLTVDQTIEKLKEISDQGMGGWTLGVSYDPGFSTLGGTPMAVVDNVSAGFDWDTNKVFLNTDKRLGVVDQELRDRLSKADNENMCLKMMIRRLGEQSIFDLETQVQQIKELADRDRSQKASPKKSQP